MYMYYNDTIHVIVFMYYNDTGIVHVHNSATRECLKEWCTHVHTLYNYNYADGL